MEKPIAVDGPSTKKMIELGERAAAPRAKFDLVNGGLDLDRESKSAGDRLGGLTGTIARARLQLHHRLAGEAVGEARRLRTPVVVEPDPRRAADQDTAEQRMGGVSHEKERGHDPDSVVTPLPARTRWCACALPSR